MYCDKCGTKIENGDIYCPNCGAKFRSNPTNNKFMSKAARRIKRKTLGFIGAVAVLLCVTAFYNNKSALIDLFSFGGKSSLVGRWVAVDDGVEVDYGDLDRLEFFSDGTYTSDSSNYSGSYSVDHNRLRLSGVLASAYSFDFRVRGDTLIIYDEENYKDCEYERVSD